VSSGAAIAMSPPLLSCNRRSAAAKATAESRCSSASVAARDAEAGRNAMRGRRVAVEVKEPVMKTSQRRGSSIPGSPGQPCTGEKVPSG
jgi:hypothetical protein